MIEKLSEKGSSKRTRQRKKRLTAALIPQPLSEDTHKYIDYGGDTLNTIYNMNTLYIMIHEISTRKP